MSKFIKHSNCPECGSSDALAVYSDNHHCYSCGHHINLLTDNDEEDEEIEEEILEGKALSRPVTPLPTSPQQGMDDRGINKQTVNKYNVTVNNDEHSWAGHIYPYFDKNGIHVANKIRVKGKKAFPWEGDVSASTLFGQQLFPSGGRAITIFEGECDALAGYQMTGSKYPCVSVKSSAVAKSDVAANFEYLNSFEKIVLCLDSDEAGKKAAQQVAQLFEPGKCHVITLQEGKDANEYLMAGKVSEYINEWHRAPAYLPDGLSLGTDPANLESIINYSEPELIPFPWDGLNSKVYGMGLEQFILFTADTGVGKTSFMKEIEYSLLTNPELIERGYGVGILHLEEPKRETLLGLLSVHDSKPYHLPDTPKSESDIRQGYKEVLDNKRVVIYDHFGSNDIDAIIAKIRHMAALGCKYIVLDHLSIIVSDQSGDERKQLDEISTKLKTLTMNLKICVIAVIHINRQGQVRGSAGPEQVSNTVIRLTRDKKESDDWRRNITQVDVEKCRLSGRTGPACWVYYNPDTGRLTQLSPELVKKFQEGQTLAGDEFETYG